jgi:hypothetical protein
MPPADHTSPSRLQCPLFRPGAAFPVAAALLHPILYILAHLVSFSTRRVPPNMYTQCSQKKDHRWPLCPVLTSFLMLLPYLSFHGLLTNYLSSHLLPPCSTCSPTLKNPYEPYARNFGCCALCIPGSTNNKILSVTLPGYDVIFDALALFVISWRRQISSPTTFCPCALPAVHHLEEPVRTVCS